METTIFCRDYIGFMFSLGAYHADPRITALTAQEPLEHRLQGVERQSMNLTQPRWNSPEGP